MERSIVQWSVKIRSRDDFSNTISHRVASFRRNLSAARDDPIEQALQLIAARCARLLKDGFALGVSIHPIEHETMEVDIEIRRGAKSLNERHRSGVGGTSLNPA